LPVSIATAVRVKAAASGQPKTLRSRRSLAGLENYCNLFIFNEIPGY
jgi:hypothetical protein